MQYSEGDRVTCNYKNQGKWYAGAVLALVDDGCACDVLYDDGEKERVVVARIHHIPPPSSNYDEKQADKGDVNDVNDMPGTPVKSDREMEQAVTEDRAGNAVGNRIGHRNTEKDKDSVPIFGQNETEGGDDGTVDTHGEVDTLER